MLLDNACKLTIFHINDVYELKNLPFVSTIIREERAKRNNKSIITLAGDFVAPSLLSSIDQGFGMIDVLNEIGVDYVCLGNHETDIPYTALVKRIAQFKGTFINTNMPSFSPSLPQDSKIKITSEDGSHSRSVAFLGLLLHDKTIYREGVFGGAEIYPIRDALLDYTAANSASVDAIIPLTHQDQADDNAMAEEGKALKIPLILGGHDHEIYTCTHNGCVMLKTGMDAKNVAVVDVEWNNTEATFPNVSYELLKAKLSTPDPLVQAAVDVHMKKLAELDELVLFTMSPDDSLYKHFMSFAKFPEGVMLSSKKIRFQQTTVGSMMCTAVEKVLKTDFVFITGGSIRADADYPDAFSYADLTKELPFANIMVVVPVPGAVLEAAIKYSRKNAPDVEDGFLLQLNDGVLVNAENDILSVGGKKFDPNVSYSLATIVDLGFGASNEPLLKWAEENPELIPSSEAGRDAKGIIFEYYCRLLWELLPSFEEMDSNNDGKLSKAEIVDAWHKSGIFSDSMPESNTTLVCNMLLVSLDKNSDGYITLDEYESIASDGIGDI